MNLFKFRIDKQENIDFDFEMEFKIKDKKVLLTPEIKSKLDLRILFKILSTLEEKDEKDFEKVQEFQIYGNIMKLENSEEEVIIPCRIEPTRIKAIVEKYEDLDCWKIMYSYESEEGTRCHLYA